jgi:hypothetical protein
MFLIWLKQNFQRWRRILKWFHLKESLKNAFDEIKPKNGCCYDVVLPKEWDDTF